jgi:hypothetical protein
VDEKWIGYAEYLVLALAVCAFLVLWIFRIGAAPLLLLPWIVIALVATHLITRDRSR